MSLLLIWGLTQNSQEKLLNDFPYFLFRLHHKCHHMQSRISECPAACTKLRGLNPASCISHDDHLRWLFPSTATYDSKQFELQTNHRLVLRFVYVYFYLFLACLVCTVSLLSGKPL